MPIFKASALLNKTCLADGYPLEDVRMSWKDGRNSVHNVHKIEMPQFTLAAYDVISNIISLSTGKL